MSLDRVDGSDQKGSPTCLEVLEFYRSGNIFSEGGERKITDIYPVIQSKLESLATKKQLKRNKETALLILKHLTKKAFGNNMC